MVKFNAVAIMDELMLNLLAFITIHLLIVDSNTKFFV